MAEFGLFRGRDFTAMDGRILALLESGFQAVDCGILAVCRCLGFKAAWRLRFLSCLCTALPIFKLLKYDTLDCIERKYNPVLSLFG